jgi:hypothetical protein
MEDGDELAPASLLQMPERCHLISCRGGPSLSRAPSLAGGGIGERASHWLLLGVSNLRGEQAPGPALAAVVPAAPVACRCLAKTRRIRAQLHPSSNVDVNFLQLFSLCNEKSAHLISRAAHHRTIFSSLTPFLLLPPSVRLFPHLKHQIRFGRWAYLSLVNALKALDTTSVSSSPTPASTPLFDTAVFPCETISRV